MLVSSCGPDPLVHHGRHFGRSVHALCSIKALITNGLLRLERLENERLETLPYEYVICTPLEMSAHACDRDRREHHAFEKLLQTVPGLQDRLMEGTDESIIHIAELVYDICAGQDRCSDYYIRSRREFPVPGPTIRRV
jgi:hypothetical protein